MSDHFIKSIWSSPLEVRWSPRSGYTTA